MALRAASKDKRRRELDGAVLVVAFAIMVAFVRRAQSVIPMSYELGQIDTIVRDSLAWPGGMGVLPII